MSPQQKSTWQKWATIISIAGCLSGIYFSIQNDIKNAHASSKANQDAIIKVEIDKALYRAEQVKFKDSVRGAIHELEVKNHLPIKF